MLILLHRILLVASLVAAFIAASMVRIGATAVVAIGTPDRIILAADSLRVDQRGERSTSCKILPAGRWWVAIAGFMISVEPPVDLSVLVPKTIEPARTLDAVLARLLETVSPQISAALTRAHGRPGFGLVFAPGAVSQLVIVGRDADGTLRAGTLVTEMSEPFALRPQWLECPGSWCPDGQLRFGVTVDPTGPMMTALAAVERADASTARRLIDLQIRASPSEVSGPVDVVQVDAGGTRWVGREPGSRCP